MKDTYIKGVAAGVSGYCNTLPTTSGQTTIFTSGDDKDTGHGRGVDFFTLSENNPYGNNLRFTGTTGTATIQANGIMLDWNHDNGSAVHGWSTTDVASGGVVSDIASCAALTIGGLSDWLLPNIKELGTLVNYGISSKFNWSPLNITPLILKSSTFDPNDSTKAFKIDGATASTSSENIAFGSPRRFLPFRYITYAELGITGAVYPIVGAMSNKTGQTISFATFDDGDLEIGRDVDFLTLPSNNPFGNTNRFTDELGTQTYTNKIGIDWSTYDGTEVLGFLADSTGTNRTWATAVSWAQTNSVGTFTSGWYLPNVTQMYSIINHGAAGHALNYSAFLIMGNALATGYWSSTTTNNNTNYGVMISSSRYSAERVIKTLAVRTYAVRNFTVTGTTLT